MTQLAERYGTPSPTRRRMLIAFAGVLAVAGIAWVTWVVVYQSNPKVTSELASFVVVDDHEVTARFTVVRRDTDTDATCLLQALAEDHSIVGEATVPVESGAKKQVVPISIRTERGATSVELLGCTAPGQNQRR